MEYTRPNDRAADALQTTDALKIAWYRPLSEKLTELLTGWEVDIHSFAMGIRGSYTPEVWRTNLATFGIKGRRADHILCEMVVQSLSELMAMFDVRHAALQSPPHEQT